MRPSVGGSALPTRPRKRSIADSTGTTPQAVIGNGQPTTFFMASESMLNSSQTPTTSVADSNFGIRSLEEEHLTAEGEVSAPADRADEDMTTGVLSRRRRSTIQAKQIMRRDSSLDSLGMLSAVSSNSSSPDRPRRQKQDNPDMVSQPLTPISLRSPMLGFSIPSSPKSVSARSLRHSDNESETGNSQAIVSSEDEDEDRPVQKSQAQQFIMPSIMMPTRRPFTAKGKDIGRLKILLVGSSGAGKTSLIHSIVQTCEEIVHVDPISSAIPTLKGRDRGSSPRHSSSHSSQTKEIVEIFASTRSYPSWWSDLDESNVLRRRKSAGETVLERNICFVDTPGYDSKTSMLEIVEPILKYIESQMAKSVSTDQMSDSELLSFVGGSGGPLVDVVFYLTPHALRPTDIELLKRISQLTNFIPILAKSDTLSNDDLEHLKASIAADLQNADLRPFKFALDKSCVLPPYAVCSSPSNNLETMDASLLMQFNYVVHPLSSSELAHLTAQLFSRDHVSQLKHASAQKLLQYRKTPQNSHLVPSPHRTSLPVVYTRSTTAPVQDQISPLQQSQYGLSHSLVIRRPNAVTYHQARIADHTQREERLAQANLANWAANLQRSLKNERTRYGVLAKHQRLEWLRARLGECTFDESLDLQLLQSDGSEKGKFALVQTSNKGDPTGRYINSLDHDDPLRLVKLADVAVQVGWEALKVVGGCSILGAVAIWAIKTANLWEINLRDYLEG